MVTNIFKNISYKCCMVQLSPFRRNDERTPTVRELDRQHTGVPLVKLPETTIEL